MTSLFLEFDVLHEYYYLSKVKESNIFQWGIAYTNIHCRIFIYKKLFTVYSQEQKSSLRQ